MKINNEQYICYSIYIYISLCIKGAVGCYMHFYKLYKLKC